MGQDTGKDKDKGPRKDRGEEGGGGAEKGKERKRRGGKNCLYSLVE